MKTEYITNISGDPVCMIAQIGACDIVSVTFALLLAMGGAILVALLIVTVIQELRK